VPLSCNLGTLSSWNRLGHSRPVTGLLYLFFLPFTDLVDTMILKVLCDLPFGRNRPLKYADDWYIKILKNKKIWMSETKFKK
jgi:hypothetical protein